MNLILLEPGDFRDDTLVRLEGRRAAHIHQVHQAAPGESLRVGLVNGPVGRGELIQVAKDSIDLRVTLEQPATPPLPLTLVLALPRPKMLRRILQSISTLGVETLYLIHSYRVEKSYWQTPFLQPERVRDQLLLGLEQAVATHLPKVEIRRRFKPFVEDELPALAAGRRALVAHPYQAAPCPMPANQPTLLAVGPEGGFIPYEVDKLREAGLEAIHLGPRILKVETAIPVLTARLFPL